MRCPRGGCRARLWYGWPARRVSYNGVAVSLQHCCNTA
nr:hypothetical protein RVX_0733 [Nitratidesulfovibrio sp. HK-II]